MAKKATWVVGSCAIALFIIAIIGMATGSSHRWVEPVQQFGWVLLVVTVILWYLVNREPELVQQRYSTAGLIAWALGFASIALFVFAIIANATSSEPKSWIEAVELAGVLAFLGLVIIVVTLRRKGEGKGSEPRTGPG